MTEQVQTQAESTSEQPVVKKPRKQRADKGRVRGKRKPKAVGTGG